MSDPGSNGGAAVPPSALSISEADRARLAEALQELLAHGSILGMETGQTALYHWCRQNLPLLREVAELSGLEIFAQHDERMIQALPRVASLRVDLNKDATLVWLALWYVADVRWRDEGQTEALLTVGELNGVLKDTLLPDVIGLISRSRMEQILRQAARYHLIVFHSAEPFVDSGIEILPAIRRVIPFQDFADWTATAALFRRGEKDEADKDEASTAEEESS